MKIKCKYKVDNYTHGISCGAQGYTTFEEAKKGFRERIVSGAKGISQITDLIHSYAAEKYPENPPRAFKQFADILTNLATDPNYPQNASDVELDDYEDENIEFYTVPMPHKVILCYVNNDAYEGKFPEAKIEAVDLKNENRKYVFYLSDNRNFGLDIALEPCDEEIETDVIL